MGNLNRVRVSPKPRMQQAVIVTSLLLLLGACTAFEPKWTAEQTVAQAAVQTNKEATTPSLSSIAPPAPQPATRPQAQLFAGQELSGRSRSAATPVTRTNFNPTGGDIVLNFDNLPVRDAVQMILGEQLGKDYTVAPDVQGTVSLNNSTGLARSDLIPTLEILLANIDARLEQQGDVYAVVTGASSTTPVSQQNLAIIPLKYIEAKEFAKILTGYGVTATPITNANLLAVNGAPDQVQQVRALAQSFDLNWLRGRSLGLFPIENTSAATLKRELDAVLGGSSDTPLAASEAQAIRTVAIDRTNSIMVIAASSAALRTIGQWIERLDNNGNATNQAFFVYRVQNGRATDLAELLQGMFGNGVTADSEDTPQAPNQAMPAVSNGQGNFKVIADESTNSLIVTGSPHYYKAVQDAMKELDATPLQVLVEASIMELTLTDDLQYGLEWFLEGSRSNTGIASSLDFGSQGLGAIQPGFSYVLQRAGDVRAALNGLADDSRLKVLSSPSLMVLNNRTASILVGDEVPIPTRQAVSNISPEAPTVNEIEYRNTGILLTVTPRVNSGGMVTMDISQEVSSVVSNVTSQIDAPTIQQRQINSTVSIRDGQSVVLGGLIRDQNSNRDAGVPLLKDIPGIGKLFSSTNTVAKRTELVVLITPRVIQSEQDTNAITNEFRNKMLGLRPLQLNQL